MNTEDKDIYGPELPGFHTLALIFKGITSFIFLAGVISFCFSVFIQNSAPEGISLAQNLSPSFLLMICGVLADPCVIGLKYATEDTVKYFSASKDGEKKRLYGKYQLDNTLLHVIICSVFGALVFSFLPDADNYFLGFIFWTVYTIATICIMLLMYFKKYVTV